MAVRNRKKKSAAHKRTKRAGLMKKRLYAKLRRIGLTPVELKSWNKVLDHEVKGIMGKPCCYACGQGKACVGLHKH
jgi:hypothetical protein